MLPSPSVSITFLLIGLVRDLLCDLHLYEQYHTSCTSFTQPCRIRCPWDAPGQSARFYCWLLRPQRNYKCSSSRWPADVAGTPVHSSSRLLAKHAIQTPRRKLMPFSLCSYAVWHTTALLAFRRRAADMHMHCNNTPHSQMNPSFEEQH